MLFLQIGKNIQRYIYETASVRIYDAVLMCAYVCIFVYVI